MLASRVARLGLLWLTILLFSSSVRADASPRLTDRGRLLLAGSLGGAWSNYEDSPSLQRYPRWALWAAPSLLYFVRDRLGLGGFVGLRFDHVANRLFTRRERELELGGQAAYELVLSRRIGLLPTAQLGYAYRWRSFSEGTEGPVYQRSPLRGPDLGEPHSLVRFGLFVPLIFHINEAIGVGFGPWLSWDVYLRPADPFDQKRDYHVRLGASSWIGGSF